MPKKITRSYKVWVLQGRRQNIQLLSQEPKLQSSLDTIKFYMSRGQLYSNWSCIGKICFLPKLLLLLLLSHFSHVQLRDPIDGSPPSSLIPGILQTRTLEWVTISFSNAWKWKVKVQSLSHLRLLAKPPKINEERNEELPLIHTCST